ncbi:hypothetical protein JCM10908_006878 [Rhodotorula pacifica]|uniref:uncharacterized protein n=1 Tax=Rhodotorula pacifica TaxID=1495444 RepID=UPI00317A53B9
MSHARYGYLPAEYIRGMSEANLLRHGRNLWRGQVWGLKIKAQECGARRTETLRFDFLVDGMSSDNWLRLGMEKTIGDRRATFQRILIEGAHRTEIISKILPARDRLEYIVRFNTSAR